ncbi:hypothetical protein J6590_093010 [Homalodisca vitripennis]|nr:hypothetical protein J6590_093010 [Homalodisca vitripennis]
MISCSSGDYKISNVNESGADTNTKRHPRDGFPAAVSHGNFLQCYVLCIFKEQLPTKITKLIYIGFLLL